MIYNQMTEVDRSCICIIDLFYDTQPTSQVVFSTLIEGHEHLTTTYNLTFTPKVGMFTILFLLYAFFFTTVLSSHIESVAAVGCLIRGGGKKMSVGRQTFHVA